MKEYVAKIVKNERLAGDFYLITLKLSADLPEINSGQFAMLGTSLKDGLLLRRPYSIFDIQQRSGSTFIKFFYRIVGKGTNALARCPKDTKVNLLMPLGNGFDIKRTGGLNVFIVTGGIGVAPFYLLMRKLRMFDPAGVYVFYGARNRRELFFTDFFRKHSKVFISTDDGSRGYKGFVSDLFENKIKDPKIISQKDRGIVFCCGPKEMMRAVRKISEDRGWPCYLSMEEIMGCGMGACLSCVVESRKSGDYVTVCKDGPVFESRSINF